MTAYLLDVNVLVALAWPNHRFHDAVQKWFGRNSAKGWATCPFVEAGFVRVVSNPSFSERSVSPKEAIQALAISIRHPAHRFWADDIALASLGRLAERIVGHQQVTDAYLVALAIHHKGKLATLDGRVTSLLGADDASERAYVEFIAER
jgi:uncharacterized protein